MLGRLEKCFPKTEERSPLLSLIFLGIARVDWESGVAFRERQQMRLIAQESSLPQQILCISTKDELFTFLRLVFLNLTQT